VEPDENIAGRFGPLRLHGVSARRIDARSQSLKSAATELPAPNEHSRTDSPLSTKEIVSRSSFTGAQTASHPLPPKATIDLMTSPSRDSTTSSIDGAV
jgi:hypothetical protein